MPAERLNHLYSNQSFGIIANFINAGLLVIVHWNTVGHAVLLAWLGTVLPVTFGRTLLVWRFHHQEKQIDHIGIWRLWFLVGVLVSGITWGVAGIALFPAESNAHQMFTVFTIGGMVAGASVTYSVYPIIFLSFSLPAIVPVIIYALTFHDGIHIAMSIMTTLFLILMVGTCFRNHKLNLSAMRLKFEKQDLIEYLSKAKEQAESVNLKLQTEINIRKRVEDDLKQHRIQLTSTVENRTAELQERNRELQTEITERSRIETALRDSEERYRRLVENNLVGIMLIQDQVIVFANTFISTISGIPIDKIVGSPFSIFIHDNDREHVVDTHKKRIQGESSEESYTLRIVDAKAEVHWLEVNATVMTYEGNPAVLVFCRDITQQRKLELQLFQSEKMASIGQLAAGVAHEINNPVGFVNSNLTSLADYQKDIGKLILLYRETMEISKTLPNSSANGMLKEKINAIKQLEADVDLEYIMEDWHQLIQECQEGTERIKNIVIDLKSFAHPGIENRQLTDINKCIDSTLNIVWNELKYNTTIVKEFGKIPPLECYPQQLNQVFMNLLINSGQAIGDQGEIKIKTRTKNSGIEITISDTGCGIPEENLRKIFDPFYTTKAVGKGTGLGLHVSYNIIKKHMGTMEVSSKVGKGTTFTIQLPMQAEASSDV